MARLKYFILILVSAACSSNEGKQAVKSTISKDVNEASLSELCDNEIALITDSRINWNIPCDSISNMEEYLTKARNQRVIALKQANATSDIDSIYHTDPLVFPYVSVDSINIKLDQLKWSTSVGYMTPGSEVLVLICSDSLAIYTNNVRQKTYEFIRDFKSDSAWNAKRPQYLHGPFINVDISQGNFKILPLIIKESALGYIDAINERLKSKTNMSLCNTNQSELSQIRKTLPYKVRLLKYGTK